VDWAIAAILLAFALFGFLRARSVVGETWTVGPRRSLFGIAVTVVAAAILVFVWRSLLGVLIAAVLIGLALYAGWRLRRA
jgi:hypothetical protein